MTGDRNFQLNDTLDPVFFMTYHNGRSTEEAILIFRRFLTISDPRFYPHHKLNPVLCFEDSRFPKVYVLVGLNKMVSDQEGYKTQLIREKCKPASTVFWSN